MTRYSYAAIFEPTSNGRRFVVTFPDVPEAITEGDTLDEARDMAKDALGVALLTYLEMGKELPISRAEGLLIQPNSHIVRQLTFAGIHRLYPPVSDTEDGQR